MTRCLDVGEQVERTWVVKLPGTGAQYAHVLAWQMTLLEGGTLEFTGKDGVLMQAFGPTGWLEVSRA